MSDNQESPEPAQGSIHESTPPGEVGFEESMIELDRIVLLLERGQASLEESLAAFERGVRLVRQCRQILDAVELRVRELVEFDAEGRAILRPFDHAPSHEPSPDSDRSSKRRVGKIRKASAATTESLTPESHSGLFESTGE